MSNYFPVNFSILSGAPLLEYVGGNYALEKLDDCVLLRSGMNDTYIARSDSARYIVRVYRGGLRSLADIRFELDALIYLQKMECSISTPVLRADGEYIGSVFAPEGERFVVLFTYAVGKPLAYDMNEGDMAYVYGQKVAKMHAASDTFQSCNTRVPLDLIYLLSQPLKYIQPMLSSRPSDWEYLISLTEKLRKGLDDISLNLLETGFCHGDLHGWNAHIDHDQAITFFDFDFCGIGWRAYDIAVFQWSARLRGKDKVRWPSFLRGYGEIRQLADADLKAVPYFIAIREIWLAGIHIQGGHGWGFGWINDEYFDKHIAFLRKWEADYF